MCNYCYFNFFIDYGILVQLSSINIAMDSIVVLLAKICLQFMYKYHLDY